MTGGVMLRERGLVSEELLTALLLWENCRLGECLTEELLWFEEPAINCPFRFRFDFECSWKNISWAFVGMCVSFRFWRLLSFIFLFEVARVLRVLRPVKQRISKVRKRTTIGACDSFRRHSFVEQADDTEDCFSEAEPCECSLDRIPVSWLIIVTSAASASCRVLFKRREESFEDRYDKVDGYIILCSPPTATVALQRRTSRCFYCYPRLLSS